LLLLQFDQFFLQFSSIKTLLKENGKGSLDLHIRKTSGQKKNEDSLQIIENDFHLYFTCFDVGVVLNKSISQLLLLHIIRSRFNKCPRIMEEKKGGTISWTKLIGETI